MSPMKIQLDLNNHPVKLKVRKYLPAEIRILKTYVEKLVEIRLFTPEPPASWQSPPHLVPKDSRAEFWTTIDLRPVTALSWTMTHLQVETQDFKWSKFFATIDFISSFWMLTLNLIHLMQRMLYVLVSFIGQQELFMVSGIQHPTLYHLLNHCLSD